MKKIFILLALVALVPGCGEKKPATGLPPQPGSETPVAITPAPAPPANAHGILLPPPSAANLELPCAARLAGLRDRDDAAARAAIFINALLPAPAAAEAGCLLPIADWYAKNEKNALARSAASLMAAQLSGSPEDNDRFIGGQPSSAKEYSSYGLRPDLYEPIQDRLIALAASGSASAAEKLLRSLYFHDAKLQDRLLPYLAAIANKQPAAFYGALGAIDEGGASFILGSLRGRDLNAFRRYLRGLKGADAERAQVYLQKTAVAEK